MSTIIFPSIFVPIVGLIFPFVSLGWFLTFIQKENIN